MLIMFKMGLILKGCVPDILNFAKKSHIGEFLLVGTNNFVSYR